MKEQLAGQRVGSTATQEWPNTHDFVNFRARNVPLRLQSGQINNCEGENAVSPRDFGPTTAQHSMFSRRFAHGEAKSLFLQVPDMHGSAPKQRRCAARQPV